MTPLSKDEILRLAREAGATPYTNRHYPENPHNTFGLEQLEKFAQLCRADLVEELETLRYEVDAIAGIKQERDALKADAERYRALRDSGYLPAEEFTKQCDNAMKHDQPHTTPTNHHDDRTAGA